MFPEKTLFWRREEDLSGEVCHGGGAERSPQRQDWTVIEYCGDISDIEVNPLMVYEKNGGAIAAEPRIAI
jgi:hypothetical protein